MSYGSAREAFSWAEMCDVELHVLSIERQKAIIKEYNIILNRIKLNSNMIEKFGVLSRTLYNEWFDNKNNDSSETTKLGIKVKLQELCTIGSSKYI